jgi:hypothetical protein
VSAAFELKRTEIMKDENADPEETENYLGREGMGAA